MEDHKEEPPREEPPWADPEERQEWAQDSVTECARQELQGRQQAELDRLLVQARRSTDPAVARSIGAYDAIAKMIEMMSSEDDSGS